MSEEDKINDQESSEVEDFASEEELPEQDLFEEDVSEELDASPEAEKQEEAVSTDSKPKKKKKSLGFKILIVIIIVVVVLAGGGGAAYGLFHNTPGFCNAICHVPMDPYVKSYEEGISVNAQQADSGALLSVTIHKDAGQDITCLVCHQDGLSEQIQEGMAWISGNYELPLEMKLTATQPKEGSGNKDGVEFCLREGCHEGITSLDDLKKFTADLTRNPHNSHLGNQDCSTCHQTHEQSFMYCTQCHADAKVPDGWLTYKEQQAQKKAAEGQ